MVGDAVRHHLSSLYSACYKEVVAKKTKIKVLPIFA